MHISGGIVNGNVTATADSEINLALPTTVGGYFESHDRSAVTMMRGRVTGRDLLCLPRIPIYDEDGPDEVRLKVMTW